MGNRVTDIQEDTSMDKTWKDYLAENEGNAGAASWQEIAEWFYNKTQEARFIADKKHAFIEKQAEALREQEQRAERAEALLRALLKACLGVRLMVGSFSENDTLNAFDTAMMEARAALLTEPKEEAKGE